MQAENRRQAKTLLREYAQALNQDFAEEEMERELER